MNTASDKQVVNSFEQGLDNLSSFVTIIFTCPTNRGQFEMKEPCNNR